MATALRYPPVTYIQNLPLAQRRFIQSELLTADQHNRMVGWEYVESSDGWELHSATPEEIQIEFDQWRALQWDYQWAEHWLVLYGFKEPVGGSSGNGATYIVVSRSEPTEITMPWMRG